MEKLFKDGQSEVDREYDLELSTAILRLISNLEIFSADMQADILEAYFVAIGRLSERPVYLFDGKREEDE